jgi:hypothetical protein
MGNNNSDEMGMIYTHRYPDHTDIKRLEDILDWAKTNCHSYITLDAVRGMDSWHYAFRFGSEQDLVLFQLRWA